MTANASGVLTALLNHAHATGVFEVAMLGEPKSEPPSGLLFALWMQRLGPGTGGGLATTNALLQASARIYYPAMATPTGDTELKVVGAADAYLGRLNGDFTLGGIARNVDLLGETGEELAWEFGYLQIGTKWSRIADLQIRVILNDAWTQSE